MTGFQLLMLLLASGLVINVFWGNISSALGKLVTTKEKVIVQPEVNPQPVAHTDCEELVDVISSWSHLKECCEAQGLKQAVIELEKIFPLFVVKS